MNYNWYDEYRFSDVFLSDNINDIINQKMENGVHYVTGSKKSPPAGLTPYLRSLYDFPVLTRDGEKVLFTRMNYAKYRMSTDKFISQDEFNKWYKIASDTRNELINCNLRLVISIAKRYSKNRPIEDVVSDGNLALAHSVDKFDVYEMNEKGTNNKFGTYATYAINRQIWTGFGTKKQIKPNQMAEAEEILLIDKNSIKEEGIDSELLSLFKDIFAKTSSLSPRERTVLDMRFGITGEEYTLNQIGKVLRRSKERVRQIAKRGLSLLKEELVRTGKFEDSQTQSV